MIYILDTDVFTLAELPDSPEYLRLHARVAQLETDDRLATTIITYEEQTRGWLAYAAKSREIAHQIKAYDRMTGLRSICGRI
jgi:tRNA(fMet)-specific endonuclease VapC